MVVYNTIDGNARRKNTNPEPRPCTKGFALAHPGESEYRDRNCCREYWSGRTSVREFRELPMRFLDFRTTAKDKSNRLPTVNPPKFTEWSHEPNGVRLVRVDGECEEYAGSVITREQADNARALTNAYDELHGSNR